jgi:hypothetical protein
MFSLLLNHHCFVNFVFLLLNSAQKEIFSNKFLCLVENLFLVPSSLEMLVSVLFQPVAPFYSII